MNQQSLITNIFASFDVYSLEAENYYLLNVVSCTPIGPHPVGTAFPVVSIAQNKLYICEDLTDGDPQSIYECKTLETYTLSLSVN